VLSSSAILVGTGLTCMIPACMVCRRGTSNLLRAKFTLLFIETSFDLMWISLGLYYTKIKGFGTPEWFTSVMGVSFFLPFSFLFFSFLSSHWTAHSTRSSSLTLLSLSLSTLSFSASGHTAWNLCYEKSPRRHYSGKNNGVW